MSRKNTTAVNKRIVFVKDDAGWYADMEGTRQQNALVAGADKLAEAMADDHSRIEMIFSSDVAEPGDHIMRLHRVTHDPLFGATYRVEDGNAGKAPKFRGPMGLRLAYICNQCHKAIGEHPKDIYIHSVRAS